MIISLTAGALENVCNQTQASKLLSGELVRLFNLTVCRSLGDTDSWFRASFGLARAAVVGDESALNFVGVQLFGFLAICLDDLALASIGLDSKEICPESDQYTAN